MLRGKRLIVLAIVALGLMLCCCATWSYIAVRFSPTPTATATATLRATATMRATATQTPAPPTMAPSRTPEPTRTTAPTRTPEPTRTTAPTRTPAPPTVAEPTSTLAPPTVAKPTLAVEPTWTSAPTAIPAPTRTAAPSVTPAGFVPTDAEAGYAAAIVQITQGYVDALRTLGEQSRLAGNNPALMVNDTWKIKTVIALGLLKFHGDQVRQLSAPSQRFAGVHADLLNAADNFDACADLYARGVDALSGDLLNQASQRMNAGNEAIQRASEKLRALQR